MAATQQDAIVRQNQSSNVRQLLKDKGIIHLCSTYEIMVYTQLWSDFCIEGPTPEVKKRFQAFDGIMAKRLIDAQMELETISIDTYTK